LAASFVFLLGCSGGSDNDRADELSEISSTVDSSSTTIPAVTIPAATVAVTTTEVPDDGRDESCVVAVQSGDSLGAIAVSIDSVSLDQILDENRLEVDNVILPGDELDVCIGNDVDDVTGSSRLAPPAALVRLQQNKLNDLLAPYRLIPLGVDGDSGQLTRQMLCAARMGLGLPITGGHLAADSDEAETIMNAAGFGVPKGAATWSNKWILIDKTCQVMFTGEGEELVNIYPTSTGEPGSETRGGQSLPAFRYDPALDTGGWHDSTNFPVAIDNPQNGNMYKPIYFNSGQAIHGANYVPPNPQSKGCARTFPLHQDELISWIGIDDVTEPMWSESKIGVTVTVQGAFRPTG
jgi:hypothetical protein